jgi:hypothetical protein
MRAGVVHNGLLTVRLRLASLTSFSSGAAGRFRSRLCSIGLADEPEPGSAASNFGLRGAELKIEDGDPGSEQSG